METNRALVMLGKDGECAWRWPLSYLFWCFFVSWYTEILCTTVHWQQGTAKRWNKTLVVITTSKDHIYGKSIQSFIPSESWYPRLKGRVNNQNGHRDHTKIFVQTCHLLLHWQTLLVHINISLHIAMAIPTSGKYISFRKKSLQGISMHLYHVG